MTKTMNIMPLTLERRYGESWGSGVCVCVLFFDQFKALLPLGMHQNYDKSDVRKNSPQWMMVY